MKFKIEQIAIAPVVVAPAMKLLKEMGAADWSLDTVRAKGEVFGAKCENEADLAFNYQLGSDKLEFEILSYEEGVSWIDHEVPCISHLGMHCTAEELEEWREFFAKRSIDVAQEVNTQSHTNPAIAGQRWYKYVIFDTRNVLGVDLKFIVRLEAPAE